MILIPTPSETATIIGGILSSTISSATSKGWTINNANPACINSIVTANKIAGMIPINLPLFKRKIRPASNPAKIVAIEQGIAVTPPRKRR